MPHLNLCLSSDLHDVGQPSPLPLIKGVATDLRQTLLVASLKVIGHEKRARLREQGGVEEIKVVLVTVGGI